MIFISPSDYLYTPVVEPGEYEIDTKYGSARPPAAGDDQRAASSIGFGATPGERWFTEVYRNPPGTDASGIHGTPEQVREKLEALIAMGANHLMLNPVSRHVEQVEALVEVVGLK